MWLVSLFALALIALPTGVWARDLPDVPVPDATAVAATMRRAFDWQMSNLREGLSPKHGWTRAVLYAGVTAAGKQTGDDDYISAALAWAQKERWQLGPRPRHADDHCAAQAYIEIWSLEQDPTMLADTRTTFDRMVADPMPGREEWWWCDALFMDAPSLAMLSWATGDARYIDLADSMWWDAVDALYDPGAGLFHRDATKRDPAARPTSDDRVPSPLVTAAPHDGIVEHFWGRGNGWVIAATARMLDAMPADYPSRQRYENLLQDMAARLAALQGPDGLWRSDLLITSGHGSVGETSASGLICYALAWGVNEGLLDAKTYGPVVSRAWFGLADEVDQRGRLGHVQQFAAGPGPVGSAQTAEYGVGALLLAGSEVLAFAESAEQQQPVFMGSRDGDGPLPGESYQAVTSDGAWCWFAGPRAVCFEGEHRRTYLGWINRAGDICVASVDADTREIVSSVAGRIDWPNDHACPSVLVGDDGHIMVFYCGHAGHSMRYRTSLLPEDVSGWGEELQISTNTPGMGGYSYPSPVMLKEDERRYILFWRGGDFKPCFSVSSDGITWSEARPLLSIQGERRRPRPYVRIESNALDTVHIAFTNGHPEEEPFNNVYYVCYRNGLFQRADGTVIGTIEQGALDIEQCDLVYDARVDGTQAWLWDIASDAAGRPIITYATFPQGDEHQYWYEAWNGSEWIAGHVTHAGGQFPKAAPDDSRYEPCYSGGIVLDRADPSVVYLSRPVDGVFEIERWRLIRDASGRESDPEGSALHRTADGFVWESAPITAGSRSDNVRPCVPEGGADWGPEVMWMHGDYMHYADFHTDIRIK